jgi:hypothetical protein
MKIALKFLTTNKFLPVIFFICIAMCASLVSSNYLNRDGALYIFQAHYINQENYEWAEYLYKSTWYAYLIAMLSKITSLPYLYSAKIINLLSLLTSTYFFFRISEKLLNKKNLEWAAILSLLISIPIMDKYFPMVIRDHLFISFILIGVYFSLQFLDFGKYKDFLILSAGFVISGFFRPEGWVLFIIAIVFFLFTKSKLSKTALYYIFIAMLTVFLCVLLNEVNMLPRFDEIGSRITNLGSSYKNIPSELMLFPVEYHNNSPFINIVSVMIISVKKWLYSFGFISFLFFIFGVKKYVNNVQKNYLLYFILIIFLSSIVIPVINFISTHIMTSRYYLLSYWIANFFVVISMYDFLYNKNQILNRPIIKYAALALIIISLLNIFIDQIKENELLHEVEQWSRDHGIDLNQCWIDDYRLRVQLNAFNLPPVDFRNYNKSFFVNYQCLVITQSNWSNNLSVDFNRPQLILKNEKVIARLYSK